MGIYKKYKLEKDMCDELTQRVTQNGWTVYPEQGGWDLLIIRNKIQVGIQAKLRPTVKLFAQAIVPEDLPGPQYRAIAIGNMAYKDRAEIVKVAKACGLILIDMSCHHEHWLSFASRDGWNKISWRYYRHFPKQLIWIPPFIPKLAAGIPAPKNVSPWKVVAVRLEFIFDEKGWVTIEDARQVVNEEIPNKSSYARTLLQTYFRCTKDRAPGTKRGKKWILRTRPSKKFPYVFKELKEKK